MDQSRPLFLYFRLLNTVDRKTFNINFCQWLYLNCGPLESEATTLPTEPQPPPCFGKYLVWFTNDYKTTIQRCHLKRPILKRDLKIVILVDRVQIIFAKPDFPLSLASLFKTKEKNDK